METCGELFCEEHGTFEKVGPELNIIKMNMLHEGTLSSGLCGNCKIMVEFRIKRKIRRNEDLGFKTFGPLESEIKRHDKTMKGIVGLVVLLVGVIIYIIINKYMSQV